MIRRTLLFVHLFFFIYGASFAAALPIDEFIEVCGAGSLEEVHEAVASGADVNATDADGWTALMAAADKGNTEVVAFLVDRGADIHRKDRCGTTALMAAAGGSDTRSVQLLVNAG